MSLKILAAPEAKLTPFRKRVMLLDLDAMERYGGMVGKPIFSAAQNSKRKRKEKMGYVMIIKHT